MKIGLLREGKIPADKRVPFSPLQCKDILNKYPSVSIYIQPSSIRCFPDEEYQKNGVKITEDLSCCNVVMGIKEVPVDMLINNKLFFFFSPTIKKQPYKQKLLKQIKMSTPATKRKREDSESEHKCRIVEKEDGKHYYKSKEVEQILYKIEYPDGKIKYYEGESG